VRASEIESRKDQGVGPRSGDNIFILHPSSFILHPSSFILHPSSFILTSKGTLQMIAVSFEGRWS
jgi:hypothetical protein